MVDSLVLKDGTLGLLLVCLLLSNHGMDKTKKYRIKHRSTFFMINCKKGTYCVPFLQFIMKNFVAHDHFLKLVRLYVRSTFGFVCHGSCLICQPFINSASCVVVVLVLLQELSPSLRKEARLGRQAFGIALST